MAFSLAADLTEAREKACRNLWTIDQTGGRTIAADVESFRMALFEDGGSVQSNLASANNDFIRGSIMAWNVALRELQVQERTPPTWVWVRTLQYTLLAVAQGVGASGAGMPNDVLADYNAILAS